MATDPPTPPAAEPAAAAAEPGTTVVRPARPAARPAAAAAGPRAASGPIPDERRGQATFLIGAVVTALLVALFLGGMLVVTVIQLSTAAPR